MRYFLLVTLISQLIFSSVSFAYFDGISRSSTEFAYYQVCQKRGEVLDRSVKRNLGQMCKVVVKSELCSSDKVLESELKNCDEIEKDREFTWDDLSGCMEGFGNTFVTLGKLVTALVSWAWENVAYEEKRDKTFSNTSQYIKGATLYLITEHKKSLGKINKRYPELYRYGRAAFMVKDTVAMVVMGALADIVAKEYSEFACYNSKARAKLLCQLAGDIFIPPAALLLLFKKGPKVAARMSAKVKDSLNKRLKKRKKSKIEPDEKISTTETVIVLTPTKVTTQTVHFSGKDGQKLLTGGESVKILPVGKSPITDPARLLDHKPGNLPVVPSKGELVLRKTNPPAVPGKKAIVPKQKTIIVTPVGKGGNKIPKAVKVVAGGATAAAVSVTAQNMVRAKEEEEKAKAEGKKGSVSSSSESGNASDSKPKASVAVGQTTTTDASASGDGEAGEDETKNEDGDEEEKENKDKSGDKDLEDLFSDKEGKGDGVTGSEFMENPAQAPPPAIVRERQWNFIAP